MSEPHAILCVLADGDPGGLTADGPCGGRPPRVHRALICESPLEWSDVWSVVPADEMGERPPYCALPLWWAGAPVPDGIFRAWQAWDPDEDPEFEGAGWTAYDALAEALDGHQDAADWLARALVRCGKALRAVVLDVDGTLVERAP